MNTEDPRRDGQHRHTALLRVARRLALETAPGGVMGTLLAESVALLRAQSGVVRRWDSSSRLLYVVQSTPSPVSAVDVRRLGQGLAGRAARELRPVLVNSQRGELSGAAPPMRAGIRSAICAPLLHEGRLLGTLSVGRTEPSSFSEADVEMAELLGSLAVAVLIGQERSRLAGVLLAARTAQHEMNNRLALTVGYAELLAAHPELAPSLRPVVAEALRGAREAADVVSRLQAITHLQETDWGPNSSPTIDLSRSAPENDQR